jgi:copper chaperone
MNRIAMDISGMSCEHCVRAVSRALEEAGAARVDEVAIGRATVTFDPATTSAERLAEAVADEGYAVEGTAPA